MLSDSSRISARLIGGIILGFAVCLSVGVGAGVWLMHDSATGNAPNEGSVDVGFARDMRLHHEQAVEMSALVRDRTRDREVRTLAFDIMLTQQQQMGQMAGWLNLWGLPATSSEPPMEWMASMGDMGSMEGAAGVTDGHAPAGGLMPGMATDSQLDQLRGARGRSAERVFLQLMIPHHRAGVAMAAVAVEEAQSPAVRQLAEGIVNSQQAEIRVLNQMLYQRGGAVGPL